MGAQNRDGGYAAAEHLYSHGCRNLAFVGGFVLIGPGVADQTAVQNELASGDGVPTETQRQRLERASRRMQLANRIDLPLLLLAGLTMAAARYL